MRAIAANWKTLVTAVLAGLVLFFASLQIAAGRPSLVKPETPVMAPLPQPEEQATSNEIRDFPQLG